MLVTNLQSERLDDRHGLSADVVFEAEPRETHRVWFRWPEEYGAHETPGDPYLAGLVVSAMACRERLHIDAPTSHDLLAARHDPCFDACGPISDDDEAVVTELVPAEYLAQLSCLAIGADHADENRQVAQGCQVECDVGRTTQF